MEYVIGADGCRSGWLICRLDAAGTLAFKVRSTFTELLECDSGALAIAIDIPIGLTEDGAPRVCDVAARRLLAGRASSVFPAPGRRLLKTSSYADACRIARELRGKAISRQAFAILPKIAEVDAVMDRSLQERVVEVHPEICFWRFDRSPMQHSKKTGAGYEERRRLLNGALRPYSVPQQNELPRTDAHPDDFLDASVAALTALRLATGEAERLPPEPEVDAKGLRMEMVY